MDTLIQKLQKRIKKSATEGGSENLSEIAEHFISEGYTEEELKAAFSEVFKSQNSDLLDT